MNELYLKSNAHYSDDYCIFGINFTVKFDSALAREHYYNTYKHFKTDLSKQDSCDTYYIISEANSITKPLVIIESETVSNLKDIFLKGSNQRRFHLYKQNYDYIVTDSFLSDKPTMIVQNNACIILDLQLWNAYAEHIIFNSILFQIPNHYLLHAGVVSWKNKGIVICGASNMGKSTLTLKLVENGFKFLSDEVASIDLTTCELAPFPRALGFREDTLNKFSALKSLTEKNTTKSLMGENKWTVDIEDIYPDCLGTKCQIDYLIFLNGFSKSSKLTPISKSEVLFESLKYSRTSEQNPFKHLMAMSNVVKKAKCYKFDLGDREENVKVLKELIETTDGR